jgi:hypothetical protein
MYRYMLARWEIFGPFSKQELLGLLLPAQATFCPAWRKSRSSAFSLGCGIPRA